MNAHSELIRGPIELFGVRFEECDTGGGCVALIGEMPDGTEVLITGYNEAYLPTRTDWNIGFYDHDQQQLALCAPGLYDRGDGVNYDRWANRCTDCERSYGPHTECQCEVRS